MSDQNTMKKEYTGGPVVTGVTGATEPRARKVYRCVHRKHAPDWTEARDDGMLEGAAPQASPANDAKPDRMTVLQGEMKAMQNQMDFICRAMGKLLAFDNCKPNVAAEHIEGEEDMLHKAKLPNGTWVTGNSAQQLADRVLEAANCERRRKETPLMENYIQIWFDTYKRPKLRPGTTKTYWTDIKKHIIPFFAGKHLDEIRTEDIQRFYTSKENLSKSTVHHLGIYLHQIFDSAIEDHYIESNPTVSKRLTMSQKVTEREPVSHEHVLQIIKELPKLQPVDKMYLACLLYTGARRGEVLALRWENIDFANNLINIKDAVNYGGKNSNQPMVGPTKSKAGVRTVPMLPGLRSVLAPNRQISGLLFESESGQPLTERTVRCMWTRIGEKVPVIKENDYTAHQFRHAFATSVEASGVDPKTLQVILGHSDIGTTMNRYVHGRVDRVKAVIEQCNTMFEGEEAAKN